jgi:hypothetical protein
MTRTYDIEESLPLEVPVPEWPERTVNVHMTVVYPKVNGTLELCAMGPDDVFVEGNLTYRGHGYAIKYIHTNDQGMPKGYWYARDEAERALVTDGSSQVHGVIPQDGTIDYALAQAVGGAPKTFVRPLLDALADTVQRYLVDHKDHAVAAREASLIQSVNRAATSYNRLAEGAAKAFGEYEEARKTLAITRAKRRHPQSQR